MEVKKPTWYKKHVKNVVGSLLFVEEWVKGKKKSYGDGEIFSFFLHLPSDMVELTNGVDDVLYMHVWSCYLPTCGLGS